MDRILQELSDSAWWMSVVVAGIIVNLISAYARDSIDRFRARFSKKWREKLRSDNELRMWRVSRLAESPEKLADARHREIGLRITTIQLLVLLCLIYTAMLSMSKTSRTVLSYVGAIVGFAYMYSTYRAVQLSGEISDALHGRNEPPAGVPSTS
jgi:hypothetical protein